MSHCKSALVYSQLGHFSYTGTQVKCSHVYGELCFATKDEDFGVSELTLVQISVKQELVQQSTVQSVTTLELLSRESGHT